MKKILIGLWVLLLMVGCSTNKGRLAKTDPARVTNLLAEEQSFVLFVSRPGCESCEEFEQTVQQTVKNYAVTLYYIPVSDDQNEALNVLVDNALGVLDVVPTTYLIKNGKVIDRIDGSIGYNDFIDWLDINGYLSK